LLFREDAAAHRLARALAAAFLKGFQFIQPPNEQEIGELLEDLQRVGNTTAPERIPDSVYLVAELTG